MWKENQTIFGQDVAKNFKKDLSWGMVCGGGAFIGRGHLLGVLRYHTSKGPHTDSGQQLVTKVDTRLLRLRKYAALSRKGCTPDTFLLITQHLVLEPNFWRLFLRRSATCQYQDLNIFEKGPLAL